MAILHVNEENFDELIAGEKPVFVDFFATWCGPCKMLAPILEQVEQEMNDKVVVAKVDIDECMELAKKFGIMSIPTMILFKDSAELARAVGFRQKSQIEEMINGKIDG